MAPADVAPLLLPPTPEPDSDDALAVALLDALGPPAAWFFRGLSDRVGGQLGAVADTELAEALWRLVWVGTVTNDTLAPVRSLLGASPARRRTSPARAPRGRYARPRAARPSLPTRSGPPSVAGRWSRLPPAVDDPSRRAAAQAEVLLDRHGVVTRGAVAAERVAGGFAAVYRVLSAFEDAGRVRRGYVVEGLGAAQFAGAGAIDRLRAMAAAPAEGRSVLLAATDPANPYGAALPWPERDPEASTHRPARAAGALVVLIDGELACYVERGGRTLLTWTDDPAALTEVARTLAGAVHDGRLGRITVERADGTPVTDTPLADALAAVGFHLTPRGLRLRR